MKKGIHYLENIPKLNAQGFYRPDSSEAKEAHQRKEIAKRRAKKKK